MVLAGGNDQIELIKGLRRRFPGIEVILIDMNPNVRAKEYADRMLVISTMDFDAVKKAAREENIDLILSACGDQPMRTMAYVSEQLGLPCYLSYEDAENLTNKGRMKNLMIEGGIPTSRYDRFDINSEPALDGLTFPLVVKPVDNNGSKGVIRVNTHEELKAALAEARKFSGTGDVILEEFKSGEELSVEAFISNGNPIIVFASKNIKIKDRDTFTICRNEYIPNLNPSLKTKIEAIVASIGKVFGIDNVPLLIQMIVDDKGDISVIEFSARTGGGSKLFFIRRMTGVDVIDNLIDITLGLEPKVNPRPSSESAAINYCYTNPGVFTSIVGADELRESGIIEDLYQYKMFGSAISGSNYSADRPLGVLITGRDETELEEKTTKANNILKILDENGKDIMRHDIFQSLN